jgi:hypothetical protein
LACDRGTSRKVGIARIHNGKASDREDSMAETNETGRERKAEDASRNEQAQVAGHDHIGV